MKRFGWIGLALAATLGGCGGGGGGGDSGNTVVYAPAAAWRNLHGSTRSWTLSGNYVDGNVQGSLTTVVSETLTSAGLFPYNGESSLRRLADVSYSYDGQPASTFTSINYYKTDGSLLPVGATGDGFCDIASNLQAIPESATQGQSGPLVTINSYDSCNPGATLVSTASVAWSIENIGGKILLCENTRTSFVGYDGYYDQESDCYEMTDSAGTIGPAALISYARNDGTSTYYTEDVSTP